METGPARWQPSFSPVDSGLGPVADLYTFYSGSGGRLKYPRMSWTADGSALLVASIGPRLIAPPIESSLWAVSPPDAEVSTLLTVPGSDEFTGVICHTGTTDCDLVRFTGVILRRKENGDTVRVMKTPSPFFTSANGRFILNNPDYGEFPPGGPRMSLFDVTTGVTTATDIPDATGTFGQPRPVAVSDDGTEVDVTGNDLLTITRHRVETETSTTWSIPKPDGLTIGYVRDLRWVGPTLYALVELRTVLEMRFVQYAVGSGEVVELGTTHRDPLEFVPQFAWRPELQRLVVAPMSACAADPRYNPSYCLVTQFELELMRGGVTTRVARSATSFPNLVMSPDGRWVGYGSERVAIKALPE